MQIGMIGLGRMGANNSMKKGHAMGDNVCHFPDSVFVGPVLRFLESHSCSLSWLPYIASFAMCYCTWSSMSKHTDQQSSIWELLRCWADLGLDPSRTVNVIGGISCTPGVCLGSIPLWAGEITAQECFEIISLGYDKAWVLRIFFQKSLGFSVFRLAGAGLDASSHDERFSQARLWAALLLDRDTKTSSDTDLTFDDQCCLVLVRDPFRKCKPEP